MACRENTLRREARRMGSQGMPLTGASRTCVCANILGRGVAHTGCEGWINILPYDRQVGVAKNQWVVKEEEPGCPQNWMARCTGTTVFTCPGRAPKRTGKAGENGQKSGKVGGSSAWTRPSAPGCGGTFKAPAGDQRPIKGGDRLWRRLRGRHRLGHGPVVLLRTETAHCIIKPIQGQVNVLRPPLRALPSVIADTEVLREEDGPEKMWHRRRVSASGGKVFTPGCASLDQTVRAGEVPEGHKRTNHHNQEDGSRETPKLDLWWK